MATHTLHSRRRRRRITLTDLHLRSTYETQCIALSFHQFGAHTFWFV